MSNVLHDTIPLMTSDDYKERFKAEYNQLVIRLDRLITFIERLEKGEARADCPIDLLRAQLEPMLHYKCILEQRALIEKVKL